METKFESCLHYCQSSTNTTCKSISIHTIRDPVSTNITHKNCHMYDKSLIELRAKNDVTYEEGYEFYDVASYDLKSFKKSWKVHKYIYLGCFKEAEDIKDFEYHLWTRFVNEHVSIQQCLLDCRVYGFKYAALHDRNTCRCTNIENRIYGQSEDCNALCQQNTEEVCGSATSNSVYFVDINRNYIGCFNDTENYRDLPVKKWGKEAGKSATACVKECQKTEYLYAGVQNGGDCFCGNSYGKYGMATEISKCSEKCDGWYLENCGGKLENAVYYTESPINISVNYIFKEASTIMIGDASGFSTQLFTDLPRLKRIIGAKLLIEVAEPPVTSLADEYCAGNCYKSCGNIVEPKKVIERKSHVTLRYFFLDLSTLPIFIDSLEQLPITVKVYAQTVLINKDITVNFALMIKARQIILDRSKATSITFSGGNNHLNVDMKKAALNGAPTDIFFHKQSYICARILLDTNVKKDTNIAWKIINNIVDDYQAAIYPEDSDFIESVRGFRTKMRGILRANVHFVPFYTKKYMVQVLQNYYNKITIYKNSNFFSKIKIRKI